jgi:hypothetical protein
MTEADKKNNADHPFWITISGYSENNNTNIIDSFSLNYTNRVNNIENDKITSITDF